MYENRADHLNNNQILQEIFFQFYCKINKPITNSCRNNFLSKPILIPLKTVFKILRKKPGEEAFRVGFIQIPEARMRSKLNLKSLH